MAISHVSVISIPVSDPELALGFYRDVVGMRVLADEEFAPGQRWLQLAPEGSQTSISLVTWFDDVAAGSIRGLILDVDDLQAERDRMAAAGTWFEDEVDETPWGRFIAFADPDGNRWSLHEPAS